MITVKAKCKCKTTHRNQLDEFVEKQQKQQDEYMRHVISPVFPEEAVPKANPIVKDNVELALEKIQTMDKGSIGSGLWKDMMYIQLCLYRILEEV